MTTSFSDTEAYECDVSFWFNGNGDEVNLDSVSVERTATSPFTFERGDLTPVPESEDSIMLFLSNKRETNGPKEIPLSDGA